MAGTTAENSFLQFVDLIMLILTLGILIAFFYFAFNVLNIKVPSSVKSIIDIIGSGAKTIGEAPQKVNIFKLF